MDGGRPSKTPEKAEKKVVERTTPLDVDYRCHDN
jgi:hypothetical protein